MREDNLQGEIRKIQRFSQEVERHLDRIHGHDGVKLSGLSPDELEDLGKVLTAAEALLRKYEERREIHDLLKGFVDVISDTAESLGTINYKIDELVLEADTAMRRIKEVHATMRKKSLVKAEWEEVMEKV